jgi:hypothetical protein
MIGWLMPRHIGHDTLGSLIICARVCWGTEWRAEAAPDRVR